MKKKGSIGSGSGSTRSTTQQSTTHNRLQPMNQYLYSLHPSTHIARLQPTIRIASAQHTASSHLQRPSTCSAPTPTRDPRASTRIDLLTRRRAITPCVRSAAKQPLGSDGLNGSTRLDSLRQLLGSVKDHLTHFYRFN